MTSEDRKAVVAAYKERKVVAGIYALHCLSSGQRWAGRAADLSTVQNRLWFTLRHGSHSAPGLQSAWNQHGADGFAFEVLEQLDDEAIGYVRDAVLKDRLAHWRGELAASAI